MSENETPSVKCPHVRIQTSNDEKCYQYYWCLDCEVWLVPKPGKEEAWRQFFESRWKK